MCGIAGLVTTSRLDRDVQSRRIKMMLDAIAHRGPDDRGTFFDDHAALGQNRLSIIDLSPLGRQPMGNEDGKIQIVFNGEIYNFMSLRNRLIAAGHRFTSKTDTEVLVHGYEEWGLARLLEELEGMFAFAIWDQPRQQLHMARDPFGIKPLYYTLHESRLVFASEVKALIAHDGMEPAMDAGALLLSFQHVGVPAPRTMFAGYQQLEPGHYLTFDAATGATSKKRYWQWKIEPTVFEPQEAERLTWEAICRSVEKHLIADVDVGLFLSGGLDSSLLAVACAEIGCKPTCLTIALDDAARDESPYAAALCRKLGLKHEILPMNADDARPFDADLARMFDEPFASSAALSTSCITQLAAKHFKVMLSGEGGDEMFGGYGWYRDWLSVYGPTGHSAPLWQRPRDAMRAMLGKRHAPSNALAGYLNLMDGFSTREMAHLFNPDLLEQHATAADGTSLYHTYDQPRLMGFDRLQWLDLHVFLPTVCLTKADRTSMAHSLEVRVPLLDVTIAKLCGQMAMDVRNPQQQLKGLLKRIAARKLPPELLSKPKQGFSTPIRKWFSDESMLQSMQRDQQQSDAWKGTFHPQVLRHASKLHGRRLWRLWHTWRWVMPAVA